MHSRIYRLILTLSLIIAGLSLVVVAQLNEPWDTVVAVLAGGAMSFFASMLIQSFASLEQSQMIKAVTLDAEGVKVLPNAFLRVKWFAWATKRASSEGSKVTKWFVAPLTKIGGSGPRFLTYSLLVPNLNDDLVVYNCTFVGLNGCVIAVITSETEPASSVIFNTDVPNAGVFFGPAYLTDWCGDRDLTLAMVGTGDIPEVPNIPTPIAAAFDRWYNKIDWTIEDAYAGISSHSKNTDKGID